MLLIALLIIVIYLLSCENKCARDAISKTGSFMSTAFDGVKRVVGVSVPVIESTAESIANAGEKAVDDIDAKITEGYSLEDELGLSGKDTRESFMTNREAINTWEPTSDFNNIGADQLYQVYAEDLKANVDQAIVESHREYTEDAAYLASTGASHASARDDFMPAVQFHGLPRSAHYANLGAQMGARTGQTETPDIVIDIAKHNTTGYLL